MLTGLAVGVETWVGGGLEVKAVLVVKDNPTPATCHQEGGEGECEAPWTHFAGGRASGRWLLPVPGSSQVWLRLPCGPSLCLLLPGWFSASWPSSCPQPSLSLPSFHKMFALFFM